MYFIFHIFADSWWIIRQNLKLWWNAIFEVPDLKIRNWWKGKVCDHDIILVISSTITYSQKLWMGATSGSHALEKEPCIFNLR